MEEFPFEKIEDGWTFECPWCKVRCFVATNEVMCSIFRCGYYNSQQINPHLPKEECEKLRGDPNLRGCAHPFYFNGSVLKKCDYV